MTDTESRVFPGASVEIFEFGGYNPKTKKHEKSIVATGRFIQWGCAYEEFTEGPGNFTAGIIELADGSIQLVSADMLRFLDTRFPKATSEPAAHGLATEDMFPEVKT